MNPTQTYSQIRYDSNPLPQTHPARLSALGRLAGMNPPAVETCRVLELGANEGGNLIPMAHRFPRAEFVGIDLVPEPVQRGAAFIDELGLQNIRMVTMDLMDLKDQFGQFDYIIAHGLYGWTPREVGDRILSLMNLLLSPNGIGFVSYNAKPAGHLRLMVREMMQFHSRGSADPQQELDKSLEMLAFLARERTPAQLEQMDAYGAVLLAHASELQQNLAGNQLYHDDLALVYEPSSLVDFVAHAGRHGLQYLDDSDVPDPRDGTPPKGLDPETVSRVSAMAGGDRIAEWQYYDYLRMRRFRQSLVCRASVELRTDWEPAQAIGLYASTEIAEVSPGAFASKGDFRMSTPHPVALAYLRRLIALWPGSEPVSADSADLALALFRAGAIWLLAAPSVARRYSPGSRPSSDSLIRCQARRGETRVTTLCHEAVDTDEGMRQLIQLLDGTRDAASLAHEGGVSVASLETVLENLARHGVFV